MEKSCIRNQQVHFNKVFLILLYRFRFSHLRLINTHLSDFTSALHADWWALAPKCPLEHQSSWWQDKPKITFILCGGWGCQKTAAGWFRGLSGLSARQPSASLTAESSQPPAFFFFFFLSENCGVCPLFCWYTVFWGPGTSHSWGTGLDLLWSALPSSISATHSYTVSTSACTWCLNQFHFSHAHQAFISFLPRTLAISVLASFSSSNIPLKPFSVPGQLSCSSGYC